MIHGRSLARARQYSKMLRTRYEEMARRQEFVERDLDLDVILASSSPKKEILFVKWALENGRTRGGEKADFARLGVPASGITLENGRMFIRPAKVA